MCVPKTKIPFGEEKAARKKLRLLFSDTKRH